MRWREGDTQTDLTTFTGATKAAELNELTGRRTPPGRVLYIPQGRRDRWRGLWNFWGLGSVLVESMCVSGSVRLYLV